MENHIYQFAEFANRNSDNDQADTAAQDNISSDLKFELFCLRNIRNLLGFKQTDGAKILGIKKSYYCKLENSGNTRINTLNKVLDRFEYDIEIYAVNKSTGEKFKI